MLHVGHHQDPSNATALKGRQDGHRVQHNRPAILLVPKPRRFLRRGFPVPGHTHRIIGGYCVIRLGRDDMAQKDADGSISSTRLNWLACGKGLGLDARTWLNGGKDSIADLAALCEPVFELR